MFKTHCLKSVQMYVSEFENGLVSHIGVDYRLFHQSLINENARRRASRRRPRGFTFDALRAQDRWQRASVA